MTASFDARAALAAIRTRAAQASTAAPPVSRVRRISSLHDAGAAFWPAGVDWHLTRDAARLSGLVAAGCEWRWCPAGGLDVVQDDGRMWCLSPGTAARMRAQRLLPDAVMAEAP